MERNRIGTRELRQNASRYLARVESGESFEVTDRGRPVALLVPVPRSDWNALLARGRVRPPEESGDIRDSVSEDFGVDASAALEAARAEES